MLEQIIPSCKAEKHLLSIAGATHPSFSDVFLIIPGRSELPAFLPSTVLIIVASWTGLTVAPYQVFLKTMEVIDHFLGSDDDAASIRWDMFKLATALQGRPKRPIGPPGELYYQTE
jgi:hypothetical protein